MTKPTGKSNKRSRAKPATLSSMLDIRSYIAEVKVHDSVELKHTRVDITIRTSYNNNPDSDFDLTLCYYPFTMSDEYMAQSLGAGLISEDTYGIIQQVVAEKLGF